MDIQITVSSNRLVARIDGMNDRIRARLIDSMNGVQQRLEAAVRADAPQRTGALRSQVGGRVYSDNPNRVAAYVGIYSKDKNSARKAAALEYGSRGMAILVRAHTAKLTHIFHRLAGPISVTRKAHVRRPTIAEHAFLRGPFQNQRREIVAELQAAVQRAIDEDA